MVYCVVCAIGMGALGWASRTRWADEFVLVDVGLSAIAGSFEIFPLFSRSKTDFRCVERRRIHGPIDKSVLVLFKSTVPQDVSTLDHVSDFIRPRRFGVGAG